MLHYRPKRKTETSRRKQQKIFMTQDFLDTIPKALSIKEKNDKMDFIKIITFPQK